MNSIPPIDIPDDTGNPEVILSAALYLMSSFGCGGGCARLAHVILRHLQALARRPDIAPVLRATSAQLAEQWERKLAGMLPARARHGNVVPFAPRASSPLH